MTTLTAQRNALLTMLANKYGIPYSVLADLWYIAEAYGETGDEEATIHDLFVLGKDEEGDY